MAQLLEPTQSNIKTAGNHIKNNGVVAFPTETVYGLGASVFSKQGISSIYRIKSRPSNNPLIMHVSNIDMAKTYWTLNNTELEIIDKLSILTPGPLTILARRNTNIPIQSNLEFLAIRIPDNKIARDLIHNSGVPIFAPSANKSGYVTSTTAQHVHKYFNLEKGLMILDSKEPCSYGVESTIIKIDNNNVSIVRPGFILKDDLEEILGFDIIEKNEYEQSEHPGSSIEHYQVSKPTKLFNFMINDSNEITDSFYLNATSQYLSKSILIDFGSKNHQLIDHFYGYVDLSEDGNPKEAMYNLYDVLHQIDKIRDAQNILIFDYYSNKDGYYKVLFDRLYRCAGGKHIVIPIPSLEKLETSA